MKHFDHLTATVRAKLFAQEPTEFDRFTPDLGRYLGALLYTPGIRGDLAGALTAQRRRGVAAMVLDLEDAISNNDAAGAQANVINGMEDAADAVAAGHELPLVFIRVRRPEQVGEITSALGPRQKFLTGFVLPKFDVDPTALAAVADAAIASGSPFLAMPVLEGPELAYTESRAGALSKVAAAVAEHANLVPVVRIGATDISGAFGLRRPADLTVYDLAVVRDVIADVVNIFSRPGSVGVVSGSVWEYFSPTGRILKPQLRTSIFAGSDDVGEDLRGHLLATATDALIHEVLLDKANGLVGKTVIHPSHTPVVNAMGPVTAEEHADALCVLASASGGVSASEYGNKMNERRPHRIWAQRTLVRGLAFGVLREGISFADVLAAERPGL